MDGVNSAQIIVTAILSSGLVTGFFAYFNKRTWSPESKNELARMGSEFAQQLLRDAKAEREELRATIKELQEFADTKQETIDRLRKICDDKDEVIEILEKQQVVVAQRIKNRQTITLKDVFGEGLTEDIRLAFEPKF